MACIMLYSGIWRIVGQQIVVDSIGDSLYSNITLLPCVRVQGHTIVTYNGDITMLQLSSIINGQTVVNVTSQGRLTDAELAQCICNASIGQLSTRQLKDHFGLFQPDSPHTSFQAWAVEKGLWATWTTKGGKVKAVGANERIAELVKLGGESAELRVLRQFDAIRAMARADKDTAERLHKMETATNAPAEKAISNPLLPVLAGYETVTAAAIGRLNRLISQVSLDESTAWIADELTAVITELKVGK